MSRKGFASEESKMGVGYKNRPNPIYLYIMTRSVGLLECAKATHPGGYEEKALFVKRRPKFYFKRFLV